MLSIPDLSLLAFALSAGAVTFLAPCAYPLLPGYIAFYLGTSTSDGDAAESATRTGRDVPPLVRATVVGALVSVGVFAVYGLLAAVVWTVGAGALTDVAVLELVVGGLLVILGVGMTTGIDPPTPQVILPARKRSSLHYLGFGVLYAVAAAGCTAPLFIGIAATALTANGGLGVLVVAAYGVGLALPLVGVTVATAFGRDAFVRELSARGGRLHRAAGVLLVLAGLVQVYVYLFQFDGLSALGL